MFQKNLTIALIFLVLTSSGCRMIMQRLTPNFFAGNESFTAAQAVKAKIGATFRVRTVKITEEKFTMTVESPANPRNIDEYNYIGVAAVGPKELPFDSYDAKETARMPFDEIDFTVIPDIVKNALDKAQIEGGKVTEIMFYTKVGNKFGWDVQIKGTRESASVRADLKGNIVGSNLSQTIRAADYKIINETELTKASDAIKAKFGADAQISGLRIDEQHVGFSAKNPENPKEIFKYSFGVDGLKKSLPIALPSSMVNEPFSINEINLVDVVSLCQKAREKLQMPDGQIESIEFRKMPILAKATSTPETAWVISIKQGASSGIVEYDTKLNEIYSKKS